MTKTNNDSPCRDYSDIVTVRTQLKRLAPYQVKSEFRGRVPHIKGQITKAMARVHKHLRSSWDLIDFLKLQLHEKEAAGIEAASDYEKAIVMLKEKIVYQERIQRLQKDEIESLQRRLDKNEVAHMKTGDNYRREKRLTDTLAQLINRSFGKGII